jgi:hypothetical protein
MRNLARACALAFIFFSIIFAAPNQKSSGQNLSTQKSQTQKLSGPEIKTLLENNTAHGIWEDREYFQFFDAKGPTIYREAGTPATRNFVRSGRIRFRVTTCCAVIKATASNTFG